MEAFRVIQMEPKKKLRNKTTKTHNFFHVQKEKKTMKEIIIKIDNRTKNMVIRKCQMWVNLWTFNGILS